MSEQHEDQPVVTETTNGDEQDAAVEPVVTEDDSEGVDENPEPVGEVQSSDSPTQFGDYLEERYEAAKVDPDYAVQQGIQVPEDEREWDRQPGDPILVNPEDVVTSVDEVDEPADEPTDDDEEEV
jgi:hypothetical protein